MVRFLSQHITTVPVVSIIIGDAVVASILRSTGERAATCGLADAPDVKCGESISGDDAARN